jgi:hypothetical protein
VKEYETSVNLNHVTRLSTRKDLTEVIRKYPIFNGNQRFITVFAQSKYWLYPEPGESGLLPLIIFLSEPSHLLLDVPSGVFVLFTRLYPLCISVLTRTRYMPHASSSARFNHLNDIRRGVQTTILPTRGGVRSTRGLGPTMTARGQSIGISIGILPQTLIMSRLDQLSRLGARI